MVRRMRVYLAVPIVILMLAIPLVQACMSPYDQYAVEILLNKPGISHDPSVEVPSVVEVDNMSFLLRIWENKDGLHLRVEIPMVRHLGAHWSYTGPVVITNGTIQGSGEELWGKASTKWSGNTQ
jgi:hypothetical protein